LLNAAFAMAILDLISRAQSTFMRYKYFRFSLHVATPHATMNAFVLSVSTTEQNSSR
jgi:hypothetical protein